MKLPSVSLWVYLAVVIFGVSSWLCVLAVWLQLPLLVGRLPEGWALPSYLAVVVQLGQSGPIAYGLARRFWPKAVGRHEVRLIFALITTSAVGLGVLALSWWRTAEIFGRPRSIGLLLPFLLVSMVDCTSTVAYLPYLYAFPPAYITAFFIGMGAGGFLSSIFALIQGSPDGSNCHPSANLTELNFTADMTTLLLPTSPVRFGVSEFLGLNVILLIFSLVSFVGLNISRLAQREKVAPMPSAPPKSSQDEIVLPTTKPSEGPMKMSRRSQVLLLSLTGWICALQNGILPSCQTFTLLPYGPSTYHLAVVLGSLANPAGCFLPLCLGLKSPLIFTLITLMTTVTSAYLLAMAILSPNPLLTNSPGGSFLVAGCWTLTLGLLAYLRTALASVFRLRGGPKSLFHLAVVSQTGSFLGAILIFPFVNFTNLFNVAQPKC